MTSTELVLKGAFAALESGDQARAKGIFLPLAEAGNATAQYGLGVFFSVGDETQFNKTEAIRCFEAALAQGFAFAAYQLAELYNPEILRGWDHFNVPPYDAEKSADFYRTALAGLAPVAEQGNAAAAGLLGDMYLLGKGATPDAERVAYWCKLCFQNGGYGISNTLWSLYSGGYFLDAYDEAEAVYWYRKMREHDCQCLVDSRWEEKMVRKGLLQESEMSPRGHRAIPRFAMRDVQADSAAS